MKSTHAKYFGSIHTVIRTPLLALAIILFHIIPCRSQSNHDSLIDRAPGLDTYPHASSVVLFDRTVIRIDHEGREHIQREILQKVLDANAIDSVEHRIIRFDNRRDTVIIEGARTRRPGGEWINVEPDMLDLRSAPEVRWASDYSRLRNWVISFDELEIGSAVYLNYRIEPAAGRIPSKQYYSEGIELFGGYEPCLEKTLVIDAASNRPIHYEMIHDGWEPTIEKYADHIIYSWTKNDSPPVSREPNSAELSCFIPRLYWTTLEDWQALGVYVSDYFWEKVDSSRAAVRDFSTITSPELQGMPALMHVAHLVTGNFRNIAVRLGTIGYEPNSADRVWENRYGDSQDKAVLFTALARLYGFAPIPVLIPGEMVPFTDLPVLKQFGKIILAVPIDDDTLWFDPSAEYYPPGELPYVDTYGNGCMLIAGTPQLVNVPAGDPDKRGMRIEYRTTLSPTGDLSGVVVCKPHGEYAAHARAAFRDLQDQSRDSIAQTAALKIKPGTRVKGLTISNVADISEPVVVQLNFESPRYAVRKKRKMHFEIPISQFLFGQSGFSPISETVQYPVVLPGRVRVVYEFTVSIPDGYAVSQLPPPFIVDNPYVRCEIGTRQGEGTVTWTMEEQWKRDMLSITDYPTLRDAYRNITLTKNRRITFSMK